ncbi:MAG: HD domain-containing protein [Sphaerochaeta sp.]|jgi:putative nucleotidyltransferase with HDIG domain|nr:HD domain-containing protein [Sphaerochaeta sp.]
MNVLSIPPVISRFARYFTDAGFSLYIVGGAVRDHLLGLKSEDYDFTTDALPDQVMQLFKHVIPTGIEHGTVTVHFEKQSFEVTTFRSEADYIDGRHPSSVTFIPSLEEDLKRRDFTINAFAADCRDGRIIDLHDGKKDLKNKIIRAIGDPRQRFAEDALRILRAARIAAKLNFSIEMQTLSAMGMLKENLSKVSAERIRDELFKLVLSDHPATGLSYLKEQGILTVILPEFKACDGLFQGGMHHEDVLSHSISACQASAAFASTLEVRLAALLHDIGKCEVVVPTEDRNTFKGHELIGEMITQSLLKRLKASNNLIKDVSHLVRHHMFDYQSNWSDSAVRRFIARVGLQYIPRLLQLRIADQIAIHGKANTVLLDELHHRIEAIIEEHDALSIKDLAVNGNDLLNLGIPKGEKIGATLSYLLETVLEDPGQNNREQLLDLAEKYQSLAVFTN